MIEKKLRKKRKEKYEAKQEGKESEKRKESDIKKILESEPSKMRGNKKKRKILYKTE